MSQRTKNKTKPLFVRIDEQIYNEVKKLVIEKFGDNYWGGLRIIVEQALNMYLAQHKSDLNDSHIKGKLSKNNPPPRVWRVYRAVRLYLSDNYGLEYEVPLNKLKEAIAYVRGTDPRTIEKWIREFLTYHCIKLISPNIFELL